MIMCLGKKWIGGSNIRNTTINVADEKDMDFVESLQSLGVNRNVARLITYLKDVEEGSSRDIEMATGLRQPDVSIAMRTPKDMEWVSEHEVKGNGKVRPQRIYALRTTIEEINRTLRNEEEPGVSPDHRGHSEAEGVKLYLMSEGHIALYYLGTQDHRLLYGSQVFHQENPLGCSLFGGQGVLQDLGILPEFG
jgi:predicted transcriptional regulator